MNSKHAQLLAVTAAMTAAWWCSAQTSQPTSPAFTPITNYDLRVPGQKPGEVLRAYEFASPGPTNHSTHKLVLYARARKEALVVAYTNGVCLVKGRPMLVSPESQAFVILLPRPVQGNEPTVEEARKMIAQTTADFVAGEAQHRLRIDLKPLLWKRETEHGILAQGYMLSHVELTEEQGRIVVNFESATHLWGKVTLDDDFKPISMSLTSSTNR